MDLVKKKKKKKGVEWKRECRLFNLDKEQSFQLQQNLILLRSMEYMLCSVPTFEKHASYCGNAAQPCETQQDKR